MFVVYCGNEERCSCDWGVGVSRQIILCHFCVCYVRHFCDNPNKVTVGFITFVCYSHDTVSVVCVFLFMF
jgi:hypothetical protein